MRALATGLAVAAILAGPAFAADAPAKAPEKTTIYRHLTLIDGTGAAPMSDMTIVVKADRIVSVGSSGKDNAYRTRDAKVVDMHGKYALPGLINTHVHMATDPNDKRAFAILRRDLYSGITTVRDMAGDTRVLSYYARSALLDRIASPDIYYAALMAGPIFFHDPRTKAATQGATPGDVPWMQAMTDRKDLKIAVAEAHGTGATALKLYADMPGPLVKAITGEAHRQNMLVWAHAAIFPATPKEGIDAGIDVDSHVCMLAYQASDKIPPEYHHRAPVDAAKFEGDGVNPQIASLFADLKARHTILDATVYVYKVMADEMKGMKAKPYCSLELAEKLAKQAHAAGVEISTGTDADAPQADLYPSLYDELGLLVHHAGFTPLEAIHAATETGARVVGQEKNIGTIAPGKLANMMFTDKDPTADIANLRSVSLTVKHGHEYPRVAFKPITKDEMPNDDD